MGSTWGRGSSLDFKKPNRRLTEPVLGASPLSWGLWGDKQHAFPALGTQWQTKVTNMSQCQEVPWEHGEPRVRGRAKGLP